MDKTTIKEKRNKLLKNKKGALSGIISGIGSLLQSIIKTFPKPVLFILFLVLLLLFGTLIQSSLAIFGTYCDSGDNPVNLGMNVFTNVGLITQMPNPNVVGLDAIDPKNTQWLTVSSCSVCFEAGEITVIHEDGTRTEITETTCFYNNAGCVICREEVDLDPVDFTITGNLRGYCYGEAIRKEEQDMSILEKWTCGASFIGRCSPPEHYYYDGTIDHYICEDDTCEGQTIAKTWDELLASKGATSLYPNIQDNNIAYDKFIQIKCRELRPRITIFGIEIFDYKIWLFLMLFAIMLWALKQFT